VECQSLLPGHFWWRLVKTEADGANVPHNQSQFAKRLHVVAESHRIQRLTRWVAKPYFAIPLWARFYAWQGPWQRTQNVWCLEEVIALQSVRTQRKLAVLINKGLVTGSTYDKKEDNPHAVKATALSCLGSFAEEALNMPIFSAMLRDLREKAIPGLSCPLIFIAALIRHPA
jgi:hypothetical protein